MWRGRAHYGRRWVVASVAVMAQAALPCGAWWTTSPVPRPGPGFGGGGGGGCSTAPLRPGSPTPVVLGLGGRGGLCSAGSQHPQLRTGSRHRPLTPPAAGARGEDPLRGAGDLPLAERVLSTNHSVARGRARWLWTFAVAPLLTALLCMGVVASAVPAVTAGLEGADGSVAAPLRGTLSALLATARVAFGLHCGAGIICAALARERGQLVVASGGRGFACGFVACFDLAQLPTKRAGEGAGEDGGAGH